MLLYVLIGVVLLIIIYLFLVFNKFVKLNNDVNEAFSTMDVYLKKRWDLIPNIVETVKGYAKHEKETFEEVVKLRNNNYDDLSDNEKINTNKKINNSISRIMALAESYPELKADKHFLELQKTLGDIEDEIAQSRKYYNAVVRNYNNKVQMVPSNIVAKLFNYKTKNMFEANDDERNNVKVEL
ncbi:MAG: LemA family protein [Bacilli bacterium]|nr:LemA family protein [Bacilli bacterium]